MKDPKAFLKIKRADSEYRPVCERVQDYKQVSVLRSEERSEEQSSRCMDCGTPFCHSGCPIGNYIPEWNQRVVHKQWEKAFELLNANNNLPEVTGRICPALCEYACVLGINDDPVTIRENELAIIEYAFDRGYIRPRPPLTRTGKKVAVIGSGPSGWACADQLNKAGHIVEVFERDDTIGGILRYGIPDFKLEKWILDRRIEILKKEGIIFNTGIFVGTDYTAKDLRKQFDCVCLAGGSRVPRDLAVEGRDLRGIYFAMDFLAQSNRLVQGDRIPHDQRITVEGKRVVVIGGGDTGADCVGTAHRQKASCVVQIEVMPQPPECRSSSQPWPQYPLLLKTSSSHEEGGQRSWSVLTKKFSGENGWVKRLLCIKVEFVKNSSASCPVMKEIPDSEFEIEADIVILAVGFLHPEHSSFLKDLRVTFDSRGNLETDASFMTTIPGVFAAGDMRRGQSLIVWAIAEGRRSAYHIDRYLQGKSYLPLI